MGRLGQSARWGLLFVFIVIAGAMAPVAGRSAPYAAFVMDARTGEVIHARNADTPLHPASLTKMMTLYIAFQAIQRGEISLDTEVRITAEAANEPPSRLGLRAGQTIRLRYLLRAAAVKSANDAATAIGIAISGSQAAFAARMNATARAMGMMNTHFINMHGLTREGHYSTARDMSILGRHLIYDFPQYYNLFSRRTADAGIAEVANTNRRFLDSYPGADGIKTGYTVAAGYNLVASAERNGVRIIATLFGGTSTADRNARITQLLDMGFAEAPARAAVRPPQPAPYAPGSPEAPSPQAPLVAANDNVPPAGANPPAARTIRVSGLVERSLRPLSRPRSAAAQPALPTVSDDVIAGVLAEALGLPAPEGAAPDEAAVALAAAPAAPPPAAPLPAAPLPAAEAPAGAGADTTATPEAAATLVAAAEPPAAEPAPPPPAEIIMTAAAIAPEPRPADPSAIEVVTRLSTSGGHHWGINVGRYPSRDAAERALIQVALAEAAALDGGVRRITQRSGGFDANIMGLTQEGADLACRRLQARGVTCFMIGTE